MPEPGQNPKRWSRQWWLIPFHWILADFRWLAPACIISIGILLDVSWYHIKESQNTQFFVTGLLAFSTLMVITVQAIIYRHQWRVMQETLRQNSEMFYIGERAYLNIIGARHEREGFLAGAHIPIEYSVKNGGKTPAFNVNVTTRCIVVIGPVDLVAAKQRIAKIEWKKSAVGITILANDVGKLGANSHEVFTPEIIAAWHNNGCWFYMQAVVTYFDIRETEERSAKYEISCTRPHGFVIVGDQT